MALMFNCQIYVYNVKIPGERQLNKRKNNLDMIWKSDGFFKYHK